MAANVRSTVENSRWIDFIFSASFSVKENGKDYAIELGTPVETN
jgi:hypothetical protein